MFNQKDQSLIRDENDAFQLAALSVIGHREDQQDSFGHRLQQNQGLVIVADGMGGHEGGKQASELAVKTFLEGYAQSGADIARSDVLVGIAKQADQGVSQLRNEAGQLLKAGSTLVAISISARQLMWCSIGDSRAYLIRGTEMVQLTLDHNYHTVLVEKLNAGLLNQREFEIEDARGEALISFLGIGNLSLVDYSETPLQLKQDDKIIMMSDGLYKVVTEEEIARIVDNFNNIGEALQALEMKAQRNAKNNGICRDNMTVALIKIK